MSEGDLFQHELPNGLVLLAQRLPGVRSAAMNLLVAAGGATDPSERTGSATVLGEMALRGAGMRNARQLTEHLDSLGLARSSGTGIHHTRFAAAALSANVVKGLEVYADVVRRPHLRDEAFGPARDLALQALEGLEDSPQSMAMIQLRQWHWPGPFSRNEMGETTHLEKLTADGVRADYAARYVPAGAILSVAGDVDYAELRDRVEALLGDWSGDAPEPPEVTPPPGRFRYVEQDSQQTHIALAYNTASELDEDYYAARLAVECLSGGMSGRLFTEIREKKGLCYSVYAGYTSLRGVAPGDRGLGSVFAYAGTSNDRAQATLDAIVVELQRLSEGVTEAELDRGRIGLKAATVMSGESSSARSGGLAGDWFTRGRLRTLDEILAAIDAVTLDGINRFLAERPAADFTTVLIGPKALDVDASQNGDCKVAKVAKSEQRSERG